MIIIKYLRSIKIKINFLLLILLPLYFYYGYGVEISVCLISVFLHEFSHVFVSNKIGLDMIEIEMFPFGGVAKSKESFWISTIDEIFISIAGPIMNFVIVIIFIFINKVAPNINIIEIIIKANLIIGLFNVLPIFPLDGGRILRSYISSKIGYKNGTIKLVYITYAISILSIIYGLITFVMHGKGIYLIFISLFILLAARKEKKMAAFIFINEIIGKKGQLLKKKVMGTHLLVALKTVTAMEMIKYFLPKKYHIIIVIDCTGKSIGTIHENDFMDIILEIGFDVTLEKLLIHKEK